MREACRTMKAERLRSQLLLVALSVLGLVTACASRPPTPAEPPPAAARPAVPTSEPPIARNQARVEGVLEVGPYLEAQLSGRGGRQGFLFVASDACRRALAEGSLVRLTPAKPFVLVTAVNGAECGARGLASLAAWRDQLPDRRASFLIVTAPAELTLVGEASGRLIAQGKLPLAVELRWPSPLDLAAVLPDTPACRSHLARVRTQMEFRPRGEDALVLRGRLEPCPVLAIAEPVLLQ
jgi:hypothetical protein